MNDFAFALSGDYGYINQLTTTTKSILYHHPGARVYIINKDIPQEWFNNINNRIQSLHSCVFNLHLTSDQLSQEHVSQPQLNEMSYGRILIPNLIPDEKRILYLDSDLIIDHSVAKLFTMDLGQHPIAAIPDVLYQGNFNSGVLLFNMPVIKSIPNIVQQMLDYGLNNDLSEGDQSVLNHFFKDNYLHLPIKYNLPIGYDFLCSYYPEFDHNYFVKVNISDGNIIHFTGPSKPWNQLSTSRFREEWWQYHDLEWSEVVRHAPLPTTLDYNVQAEFLTATNSENIKDLTKLLQAFPNCTFNIMAWTKMGNNLTNLLNYSNLHLYPSVTKYVSKQLIKHADVYLDLNYGSKNDTYLKKFQATGKPILSFDEVNSSLKDAVNYQSFANNDLNGMINRLKEII